MSAKDDIRHSARLLDWGTLEDVSNIDTHVRADTMIMVIYNRDGVVHGAERYNFFNAANVRLTDRVGSMRKKETVLAWLAE